MSGDDIIIGKTCMLVDEDVENDTVKQFVKKDCSSALRYGESFKQLYLKKGYFF